MTRTRSLLAALILALVGTTLTTLATGPATAAEYVADQKQETFSEATCLQVASFVSLGQTFTAGANGALARIELFLNAGTPAVEIEIHSVTGGLPDDGILATTTIPATTANGWRGADFTANPAQLVSGTTYAIVANASGDTGFWCASFDNPYAGGTALEIRRLGADRSWKALPEDDLAFRTYVGRLSQTIDFYGNPNPSLEPDGESRLNANASSGLEVTFTSLTPSVCSVIGSFVHALTLGTCTIAADQPGNSTYAPAPRVTKSKEIAKLSQTITFANPGSQIFGPPLQLAATASSGLPITYTQGAETTACTVSATGKVTFTAAGTCQVRAQQLGNDSYTAATPVQQTFSVGAATVTVTASNATQVYGTTTPPTVTPLVSGPEGFDPAALGTITCSANLAATDQVGSYPGATTCTGGSPVGYTVTYVPGNASVTPAPLTITAGPTTSVWGTTPPAPTPSYSGFRNDDTTEILATQPTCTAGVTASTNPGTYANTTTCSGAVAGNYTISYVKGTAKVTQAALLITPARTSTWKTLVDRKVTFTAKVTHKTTGAPVAGVPVTFQAKSLFGHRITCTGTSSASGVATCSNANKLYLLIWGPYGFTATAPGTAGYSSTSTLGKIG